MSESDNSSAPDIYSDLFNIFENPLGIMVVLHKSKMPIEAVPGPIPSNSSSPQTVAILRFSPENWKTILMVGRRQLKAREQENGQPIKLNGKLMSSLGLTEADW